MKYPNIIKSLKTVLLFTAFVSFYTVTNGQSENAKEKAKVENSDLTEASEDIKLDAEKIDIPESYSQAQEQTELDNPAGTSSYNVEDNSPSTDTGAAIWRSAENVEVLRIYSGSQEGNNLIGTREVIVPAKNQEPNSYK